MNHYYWQKAEENLPKIYEEEIRVVSENKILHSGDSFEIDLGNHYVGYFSFVLGYTNMYPDAPVRLSLKFSENRDEADADFSSYRGRLCASWLQEEILNLDSIGEYRMPRRYAARFIKISVLYTPREITLSDFHFTAVTSADKRNLRSFDIADEELRAIDAVSVNTLKNCMHRVFEDGPKRDRRLWIGDLRLEALTNYYTYQQTDIVRRCLYLFAAADCNDTGFLPGYIYENPKFVSGYWFLYDYALLFVTTLCDYYQHTGDAETFLDIYPVVQKQMDAAKKITDENGILSLFNKRDVFIDWNDALEKTVSLNGVYLYTLDRLSQALSKLNHKDAPIYQSRYQDTKHAAYRHLYNAKDHNFAVGYDKEQISVHSVVWMILGGVIDGEIAWEALQNTMKNPQSIKPVTPYMNHYLAEAMMKLGKQKEAISYIKSFWGLMIKKGADTFYEVFVPEKPDLSPYGDKMINSMCHAWSCTPSYFIRTLDQDDHA